jgi:hypothetical protein
MSESYAPEFLAWWGQHGRQAVARAQPAPGKGRASANRIDVTPIVRKFTRLKPGELGLNFVISPESARQLVPAAARQAAGYVWPTEDTETLWVQGGNELAVSLNRIGLEVSEGLVTLVLQVRSDQTGTVAVKVPFVCGSAKQPAGLYTATPRQPNAPPVIMQLWSEPLVAFAWHCLLNLVSGAASATGKDLRGNVLVPVNLAASAMGLEVQTMARHHFYGSSGLTVGKQVALPRRRGAGEPQP